MEEEITTYKYTCDVCGKEIVPRDHGDPETIKIARRFNFGRDEPYGETVWHYHGRDSGKTCHIVIGDHLSTKYKGQEIY